MELNLIKLYKMMLFSRLFEEAVIQLWKEGKISGEMHLGIGEEAIVAGIVSQLQEGDAMALDHRGTPPLLMRGIDPVKIMKELLARPDGLCSGMGGHMHLFSQQFLTASSGIVGASGPASVGFALASKYLRPNTIAVSFFGEGAINQGMLMESMNLAVAWNLPVLFVCKDNGWAITTQSETVTGGRLIDRAGSFGLYCREVHGYNIEDVWTAANELIRHVRFKNIPSYLHAYCIHPEGHFLGDPFVRIKQAPISEMKKYTGPLLKSIAKSKESSISGIKESLIKIASLIGNALKEKNYRQNDPIALLREKLHSQKTELIKIESELKQEIEQILKKSTEPLTY